MIRTEIKNKISEKTKEYGHRWGKAATYLGAGLILIAGGIYIHNIDDRIDLLRRQQDFTAREQDGQLWNYCQRVFGGSIDKDKLGVLCASLVLEFDDSRPR